MRKVLYILGEMDDDDEIRLHPKCALRVGGFHVFQKLVQCFDGL